MELYDYLDSGNGYKVRLLLAQLGMPYELRLVDIMAGATRTPFLAGDVYTVADIALYAYSHVAHEGGHDLTGFPGVRTWLARVAGQPGHVPMLPPGELSMPRHQKLTGPAP